MRPPRQESGTVIVPRNERQPSKTFVPPLRLGVPVKMVASAIRLSFANKDARPGQAAAGDQAKK